MVEKIFNNTTPYGKIRASHEGSLHSSTLKLLNQLTWKMTTESMSYVFINHVWVLFKSIDGGQITTE